MFKKMKQGESNYFLLRNAMWSNELNVSKRNARWRNSDTLR